MMPASPELLGKGVSVGCSHGFDAVVDDAERIIRPEIPARVSEDAVLKQELIAQLGVEHELALCASLLASGGRGMRAQITNRRSDELGDELIQVVISLG